MPPKTAAISSNVQRKKTILPPSLSLAHHSTHLSRRLIPARVDIFLGPTVYTLFVRSSYIYFYSHSYCCCLYDDRLNVPLDYLCGAHCTQRDRARVAGETFFCFFMCVFGVIIFFA